MENQMFSFNKNALNKLKECKINIENNIRSVKIGNIWRGSKTKQWFDYFETDWALNNLNNEPTNRYDLLARIDHIKKIEFLIFLLFESLL